ncbi:PREDICTED: pentatricopeptide repeat-containing protein At1g31790 [Tarenaya hassleriana]|uniref:pentatricopeptide repeat-containing protein At1g31790 n=1 Tax=Tarenaya hassleriana TaxID=28532 RepID=UPI00053C89D8|nr:PREDICTED: pentatricopeptide repeat-containing protein At1g31790 [Tarenaya hassleriana]
MGVTDLVLPPATPPALPVNHSAVRSLGDDASLRPQLSLRRPKRNRKSVKLQAEPIIQNPKPIVTERLIGDYGGRSNGIMQQADSRCSVSDILRLTTSLSLPVTEDLYSTLAEECTATCNGRGAYELQIHIVNSGLRPTMALLNRLLLMHVSCGHWNIARQLFDKMPDRNFHSWAIVIPGCVEAGDYDDAIALFSALLRHQDGAWDLPAWIMARVLKACVLVGDLDSGKQVHALCLKLGFVTKDLYLSSSLMHLYGRLGCSEDANLVFDQLSHTNTIAWAAKIANDCRGGQFHEVIHNFIEMGRNGIKNNVSVFYNVLKACAWMSNGERCGQQVHANVIKLGFESDCFVEIGLVEMYGKYGLVRDAEKAFERTKGDRNITWWKWNAMVTCYTQNGFYVEAIKLLYQMKASGFDIQDALMDQGVWF